MSEHEDRLRQRKAPIAMSAAEFREAGHRAVDLLADLIDELPQRKIHPAPTVDEVRKQLPQGGLPRSGAKPLALIEETADLLFQGSLFNGHPRFFGYITSSPAPLGAIGDMLAALVNPNLGGWQLSPVASEIESQSLVWIAELLGYPLGEGLLVSGGNVANIVAFLAARRSWAGESVRREGLDPAQGRPTIYASSEAHTWLQKAADISGMGTASIRWVDVDEDNRIDVAALRRQIEDDRGRGDRPFLLVGTAGSVATGAVDPLSALAEIAAEHSLWFHVDGAYGAFARIDPEQAELFRGMEQADSIAIDPHKWLYAPLEAGCVLVRRRGALRDTFSYRPSYYQFDDSDHPPTNFYEYGLQNSRGFRALKVWLGIRQVGYEGYRQMIADDMLLARELDRKVRATAELEAGSCSLSITTFRYVPADLAADAAGHDEYLNRLNQTLLARIQRAGDVFLSNAVVQGRFRLRACVVNFRTTLDDVEMIPDLVVREGRAVDRELR